MGNRWSKKWKGRMDVDIIRKKIYKIDSMPLFVVSCNHPQHLIVTHLPGETHTCTNCSQYKLDQTEFL